MRDRIQRQILDLIVRSDYFTWFLAPPGTGKSKIFCDAINIFRKTHSNQNILICVDNTPLRDINWVEELKKWSVDPTGIDILCYQTVYKWSSDEFKKYGLVVCDEVDFACTHSYSKSLKAGVKDKTIQFCIGASATLEESKRRIVEKFCGSMSYRLSIQRAMQLGLINRVACNLMLVPLDKKTKRVFEYDEDLFSNTEEQEYLRLEKLCEPLEKLKELLRAINRSTSI